MKPSIRRMNRYCLPVAANEPLKVKIRDAVTGELIDIIDVEPIEDGTYATITLYDNEDTQGPECVEVMPLNNIIDVNNRRIKIRFSEPVSGESAGDHYPY